MRSLTALRAIAGRVGYRTAYVRISELDSPAGFFEAVEEFFDEARLAA